MDPELCLNDVADLLDRRFIDKAAELLGKYRIWRALGGTEPPGGDRRAQDLSFRLLKLLGMTNEPEDPAINSRPASDQEAPGQADGASQQDPRRGGDPGVSFGG